MVSGRRSGLRPSGCPGQGVGGQVLTLAANVSTLAANVSSFGPEVSSFRAKVFSFQPNVFSFGAEVFSLDLVGAGRKGLVPDSGGWA